MRIYPDPDRPPPYLPTSPEAPLVIVFTAVAAAAEDGSETMFINLVMQQYGWKASVPRPFPDLDLISYDRATGTAGEPQRLVLAGPKMGIRLVGGQAADLSATYTVHPDKKRCPAVRQIKVTLGARTAPDGFRLAGSRWALSMRFAGDPDDPTPARKTDKLAFVVDGIDSSPVQFSGRPVRIGRDIENPSALRVIPKLLVGQRYELFLRNLVRNTGFAQAAPPALADGALPDYLTLAMPTAPIAPGQAASANLTIQRDVAGPFVLRIPSGVEGDAFEFKGVADLPPRFASEGPQFSRPRARPGDVMRVLGEGLEGITTIVLLGSPGLHFAFEADGSTRTAIQFTLPDDAPAGSWLVGLLVSIADMIDPPVAMLRTEGEQKYLLLATSTQFLSIS